MADIGRILFNLGAGLSRRPELIAARRQADQDAKAQQIEMLQKLRQQQFELLDSPEEQQALTGVDRESRIKAIQEIDQKLSELGGVTGPAVPEFKPPQQKSERVVRGGTEVGRALGIPEGEAATVTNLRRTEDGGFAADEIKRFGKGQSINIETGGGGPRFAKPIEDRLTETAQEAGASASQLENLSIAAGLIVDPDVQTGRLQPAVTFLQGLLDDVGIQPEALGVDLGNLSKKEEFDRATKQVVIDGFAKFKGNLNQKEVDIAMDSFQSLGKSEDGNIRAIAALLASAEISAERGRLADEALLTGDPELAREVLGRKRGGDVKRFNELRKQKEKEIREQRKAAMAARKEKGIPEGVTETEWNAMTPEEKALFQ